MIEGVHIDFCSTCKGIWFDQGELAFYTETPVDIPKLEEAIAAGRDAGLECPKCQGRHLVEVSYIKGQPLLLDVCASCHGVFVDRGELPQIESLSVKVRGAEAIVKVAVELEARGYKILGMQAREPKTR
jgi:Zn-finger nucleic acid-binding protein